MKKNQTKTEKNSMEGVGSDANCSTRIEWEFQYRNQSSVWQTGSLWNDESRAIAHHDRMVSRFPKQPYQLIRRTITEEKLK